MNASSTEICRKDTLGADFQQVPLVIYLFIFFFFLKNSQYCCETSVLEMQQREVKNAFLRQKIKTITLL